MGFSSDHSMEVNDMNGRTCARSTTRRPSHRTGGRAGGTLCGPPLEATRGKGAPDSSSHVLSIEANDGVD